MRECMRVAKRWTPTMIFRLYTSMDLLAEAQRQGRQLWKGVESVTPAAGVAARGELRASHVIAVRVIPQDRWHVFLLCALNPGELLFVLAYVGDIVVLLSCCDSRIRPLSCSTDYTVIATVRLQWFPQHMQLPSPALASNASEDQAPGTLVNSREESSTASEGPECRVCFILINCATGWVSDAARTLKHRNGARRTF